MFTYTYHNNYKSEKECSLKSQLAKSILGKTVEIWPSQSHRKHLGGLKESADELISKKCIISLHWEHPKSFLSLF